MKILSKIYRLVRRLTYYIYENGSRETVRHPSSEQIDVAIMALEKDLKILPLCIQGIRECVVNKIRNIYIISPDSEKIKRFCVENKIIFVYENNILNISPKDFQLIINTKRGHVNRSGWLFQQLVKLSGKIGDGRYTLFIDSDHILLNKHIFLDDKNRTIFYVSKEYHAPYFENMSKLLKKHINPPILSYVSHKMLFDKNKLYALHRLLEEKHPGKTWVEIIFSHYDLNQESGFSEFELYGYLYGMEGAWIPWREKRLKYSQLKSYITLQTENKRYMSITFPSFLNS